MHLCTCVSEEGGDGESAGSEALSLLSYTLRHVSLAELGRLRAKASARERDKLVFRKTIPAAHIEYKEGNCSKESNFLLYCAGARTGLL